MKQRIRLSESTLHRVIKESVRRILNEGEVNRFTHDEILKLVKMLYEKPIEKMYSQVDFGFCVVFRVRNNEVGGGSWSMISENNLFKEDKYTGELYLQIGRKPNRYWFEENGYTYVARKKNTFNAGLSYEEDLLEM